VPRRYRCDLSVTKGAVQMLYPDRAIRGHFTVACREPGCRSVWYRPLCEESALSGPGAGV